MERRSLLLKRLRGLAVLELCCLSFKTRHYSDTCLSSKVMTVGGSEAVASIPNNFLVLLSGFTKPLKMFR